MFLIFKPECVRCSLDSAYRTSPIVSDNKVDVYIAKTEELHSHYNDLLKYISPGEQLRAGKFLQEENRMTFVACHSVLRLLLSRSLHVSPLEIEYMLGKNNKPGLVGNPVHFNVTHTKNAFAIAISRDVYVGIDLENTDRNVNIQSIVNYYFSSKERDFILSPKSESARRKRFFLLWTRKEALLKAFGTGIIEELSEVEVSEKENIINIKLFDKLILDYELSTLTLHSKELENSILSIAVQDSSAICYYNLNSENIIDYLN